MDNSSFPFDLSEKIIIILQRLIQPNLKVPDDIFLDRLLSGIKNELVINKININLEKLIGWMKKNCTNWIDYPPQTRVIVFIANLMGILCENEEMFIYIQNSEFLEVHFQYMKMHISQISSLKLTYLASLSGIANHKSGCQLVKSTGVWREIIEIYLNNSGLFIQREALNFLIKFLGNINWEEKLLEEILLIIMDPIKHYKIKYEKEDLNNRNWETLQKNLDGLTVSAMRALVAILESWIVSSNTKSDINKFQGFHSEIFWKSLLETCKDDNLLDVISIAYFLMVFCNERNSDNLSEIKEIPDSVLEIFKIFVKEKRILNIINLAKYCQLFWNKIDIKSTKKEKSELESHFIIIQLTPVLLLLQKSREGNNFVDIHQNKIFNLTSENTQRLNCLITDIMKCGENEHSMDYALQAVFSINGNIETLNSKRAVLIFQVLANALKLFIPNDNDDAQDRISGEEQFQLDQMLCFTKPNFLSVVLNTLCALIEKFKINWTEGLESLYVLKYSAMLLNNPNLPPRIGVQTLSLIKLTMLNFMKPHLVLIMNKIEGASLECLLPLLYNKLHDPNWEIRDSCIEVIGVIVNLSDKKYPVFQKMLIEGNYCELIASMTQKDSESYVRSSALRTLAQMIRIDSLRKYCLNKICLTSKINEILKDESEGIVRREAALLAMELFERESNRSDTLMNIFRIMGYAAICDLHWEVKVNSLFFWEKVIHWFITNQGMIDCSFRSVTFSKESKKISSLTKEETKLRLSEALCELSNIGCLHILITTLKDDCDFQVVQKSAQILTDLLNVLKRYDMFRKPNYTMQQSNNHSVKRKSSEAILPEKKINLSIVNPQEVQVNETSKSDRVIEDIINELDLNLLGNVYCDTEFTPSQEIDNFSLKKIQPNIFLEELQNLNINAFLNAKKKWLVNREDDFNELLSDILNFSEEYETNALDCY